MFKVNPYRPGAGLAPIHLAGRDEEIEDAIQMFEALIRNIPTQSVIYSGLRGVGKTVLINRLQKEAEKRDIFCRHIEIETKNDFISQISSCAQSFLRKVSSMEKVRNLIAKTMDAIKSLVVSFNPEDSSFSLSIKERDLYQTINLTQTMTDLFCSLGEVAYETETPICFFIDEIHYMNSSELGSLIAALHRANQLGYPLMVIGAGLPKIHKMLSEEKTYAERLFIYREIDSLDLEHAEGAIREPARKFGVKYTQDAVNKIVKITKGYPYFIQQLCKIIYDNTDKVIIELQDVDNSVDEFFDILDSGFFKVRYERCSENDKKFVFAMVKCGDLPCTISNVAKNLGKNVKSISPSRAQLIDKGIIYPVRHKELDFTVPEFDNFIKRLAEYTEWCRG